MIMCRASCSELQLVRLRFFMLTTPLCTVNAVLHEWCTSVSNFRGLARGGDYPLAPDRPAQLPPHVSGFLDVCRCDLHMKSLLFCKYLNLVQTDTFVDQPSRECRVSNTEPGLYTKCSKDQTPVQTCVDTECTARGCVANGPKTRLLYTHVLTQKHSTATYCYVLLRTATYCYVLLVRSIRQTTTVMWLEAYLASLMVMSEDGVDGHSRS
jgi:hypothetical protein